MSGVVPPDGSPAPADGSPAPADGTSAPADGTSAPTGGPLTLADWGRQARPRLDAGVWDFLEGGAGEERTLRANPTAFDQVKLLPKVLTGIAEPDTRVRVLGREWPAPVAVAPMAYHTLAHPEGEIATARGAAASGAPLIVSTFAGRRFEDIAAESRGALWLQLYCFKDRDTTLRLVERAERSGMEALVLTVDAPYLGRRLRDLRNAFRLPPGIVPANLDDGDFSSPSGHARDEFDPSMDWSVLDWLRGVTRLPILLKGVLNPADARRAVSCGADGVIVSNHGGRQLDGVPTGFEMLPAVAEAVAGACPVLLDGGIRRGTDVLAALAAGADAVLLGRPVLHGLAVAGGDGVAAVLRTLTEELAEAMVLTGTGSVADAGPQLLFGGATESVPQPAPAPPARSAGAVRVRREDLHASLSDPSLDAMNFLNEITHRHPDAISFAPGRPFDGFFATEQIFTHVRRYLDHLEQAGRSPDQIREFLFQYGPTAGLIREEVAERLSLDEGIDVPPESIVITVGCQEAMFLAVRALIRDADDVLFVPSPCYVGITGAARLLGIEPASVPEPATGFSCAALEVAIRAERARGRRPRVLYVNPDHANPTGTTMSLAVRRELLELAARQDILLLEDSPYRLVSPGEQVPTLKSLDREGRVVHLGSLSKTMLPGARVGYAVADQQVVRADGSVGRLADELSKIKSMVTVNTSPLSQALVGGMLLAAADRDGLRDDRAAAYYGEAMRSTLEQLETWFPAESRAALGIDWNRPSGGFFLNVRVPFRADDAALAVSAEEFGVIWTPMSYFFPHGGGEHNLRLSVSYLSQEEIREGVARLARFVMSRLPGGRSQ